MSSAFVPVQTMPGWLQAFASSQPVTDSIWRSAAWLGGAFIVSIPLAVRAYKRAS